MSDVLVPLLGEELGREEERELALRAARSLHEAWWGARPRRDALVRGRELHRLAVLAEAREVALEVGSDLARAFERENRYRETKEVCEATLGLVEDKWLRARLGGAEFGLGNGEEALEHLERAQRMAGEGEDGEVEDRARDRALIAGRRADVLETRGELDEALRIRREEALPVYEQLGDVRERAVTMGKIADVLQARGELDEALRIRREEQLPVYEQLGDVRELLVARAKLALSLLQRGEPNDREEAQSLLLQALREAARLRLPEADQIVQILARAGMLPSEERGEQEPSED